MNFKNIFFTMSKTRFINFVIVFISFMSAILLVEFILHNFIDVKKFGFAEPNPMYRFHPKLLYHLNPNLQDTQIIKTIVLYEPKIKNLKPLYRIIILGDSYSQSGPKDNHWPNILRQLLKRAGLTDKIEIINTAVSGYSSWQEKRTLQILAPVLHPDLVIATWVPNDNTEDFMYVGEGLSVPYAGDYINLHNDRLKYNQVESFLIQHSRIYQLIIQRIFPVFQNIESKEIVGRTFILPPDKLNKKMLQHHIKQLKGIRDISKQFDAVFFQVFFGLLSQNYPFICKNAEHGKHNNEQFMLSYGPQVYLKKQLDTQDSVNVIKKMKTPLHPTLIWDDYGHFNTLGHRLVAGIILNSIKDRLPISNEEKRNLAQVLEREKNWFNIFNTPIKKGDFGEHSRFVSYHSEGIIDEPTTFRLTGKNPFTFKIRLPGGFKNEKTYFLTIDGYSEGIAPEINVHQKDQMIFKGTFGLWNQPEANKIIPKSIEFLSKNNSLSIDVEIIPSIDSKIILRSWCLSSGG